MKREGLGIKIFLLCMILLMFSAERALRPDDPRSALAPAIDLWGDGWRLRVLTWNVGRAYQGRDSRAQDEDLDKVVQVVEMEQPDVVALQELASEAQLEVLLAALEGTYQGYMTGASSTDRYTALLVKGTKIDFRHIPTSTSRRATAAVFRLSKSLYEVCAISAHAHAWDPAQRRAYTRDLVDWARSQDFNVIFLAGDFNFESSVEAAADSLFTQDPRADGETYAYVTRYFRDLGREGGDTARLGRRIDFIFGRGGKLEVKRVAVLKGRGGRGMDHDPLVIDALIPRPVVVSRHQDHE